MKEPSWVHQVVYNRGHACAELLLDRVYTHSKPLIQPETYTLAAATQQGGNISLSQAPTQLL